MTNKVLHYMSHSSNCVSENCLTVKKVSVFRYLFVCQLKKQT